MTVSNHRSLYILVFFLIDKKCEMCFKMINDKLSEIFLLIKGN